MIIDVCIIHASGSRIICMDTCIMDTSAWVTRPERPKGAKDEVKEARRAKRRPELIFPTVKYTNTNTNTKIHKYKYTNTALLKCQDYQTYAIFLNSW